MKSRWSIMAAHFFSRGACMSRSSGAAAELPGSERKKLAVRVLAGSETAVSPDGRVVIFMLSIRGREVDGAVARKALEEHFWLPRDADATRTFRTFENGRSRIVASSRSPNENYLRACQPVSSGLAVGRSQTLR
ncbi:DUF1488 family protein [Paraburkholderia domus]|uniref:DUF1488 family protein n=1 Tax=Paraburkholderia domus TaxID=2793075 RepID=UPI001EEFD0D4|nr:DUF1488 family protein [Paraburkholderia domus]